MWVKYWYLNNLYLKFWNAQAYYQILLFSLFYDGLFTWWKLFIEFFKYLQIICKYIFILNNNIYKQMQQREK